MGLGINLAPALNNLMVNARGIEYDEVGSQDLLQNCYCTGKVNLEHKVAEARLDKL